GPSTPPAGAPPAATAAPASPSEASRAASGLSACHRRSGRGGVLEDEAHDRAAFGAGPGVHLAALGDGQAADDVQAGADPPKGAGAPRLTLEEALEDPLVVTVGDADAVVGHGDLDVAVDGLGPDHDRAAVG